MEFRLSRHAREETMRRQIPAAWLESTLENPQQVVSLGDKRILQSRFEVEGGRIYLVRAVLATDKEPPVVVTVYRTSKVDKYWRPE